MPTYFLVIELCQLSVHSPIRNWYDFMPEFTLFTSQSKLANQNFAATSVCRNKQKGFLLHASFPSLPSFSPPDLCYTG